MSDNELKHSVRSRLLSKCEGQSCIRHSRQVHDWCLPFLPGFIESPKLSRPVPSRVKVIPSSFL